MPSSRQLAAILFTDIVGYTALMGDDETKAFNLLKANRQLQKPLIEQYNGRWIKEIGDGVLAIFSSATDAVACACTILNNCETIPGLQLRIGIHLGDIVLENNDAFGDGVNIAARLQALAPINGIWLSEAVFQNVFNKKGIEANFVKQETLKNVREPVRIYEVNFKSFSPKEFMRSSVPDDDIKGSGTKETLLRAGLKHSKGNFEKDYHQEKLLKNQGKKKLNLRNAIIALGVIVLIIWPAYHYFNNWQKAENAKNVLIPKIQKLSSEDWFLNASKAYELAKEAEKYIPNDSNLSNLWPKFSTKTTIRTNPPGANVYWKDYQSPNDQWKPLGKTPLEKIWIPIGWAETKFEKEGFVTILNPPIFFTDELNIKLDSVGKIPENMVRVMGSSTPMLIVGLEQYEGHYVGEFLMDKFEVTNKDFKVFVDSGGYKKKEYWDYPIYFDGKELSWEEAMNSFKDKTERPGPSTWEAGSYLDGKADHPVAGVSWYEAMAYAKFAGKQLPTVFHWSTVANTFNTWDLIPNSNFNGTGTVPVGTMKGISYWGVYDIGGNAREWCFNATNKEGYHFILGGAWNDPTYAFNDACTQLATDRSPSNGFRCMKKLPSDTCYDKLSFPLAMDFRDYKKEKPEEDKTFKILFREYNYDHFPLKATTNLIVDSNLFKIEKIEINAAYNNERLPIYLFLPKQISPPYQTILYFPGSGALNVRSFKFSNELRAIDFFIKSGRAVAFPIVKSTFERGDELISDLQKETVLYKQHVIDWRLDYARALDYLDTRNDIVHNNYGYFGWSWGSSIAPIICASEPRFKAIVLHVGGLQMQKTFPEVDPLNFLPHINVPVLMLNGKNDTFFPEQTSQNPFFEFIGTKDKIKKIYPGGHLVPINELVKESLSWFDKYLGQVK
jgi:dienelactone hydrolase